MTAARSAQDASVAARPHGRVCSQYMPLNMAYELLATHLDTAKRLC
jgi:hypothetical protein